MRGESMREKRKCNSGECERGWCGRWKKLYNREESVRKKGVVEGRECKREE